WQVTISFGNVLMKCGRVRLSTFTSVPLLATLCNPAVSRFVNVGKSGNTDCGVFITSFAPRVCWCERVAQDFRHNFFGVEKSLRDFPRRLAVRGVIVVDGFQRQG